MKCDITDKYTRGTTFIIDGISKMFGSHFEDKRITF